MSTDQEKLPHRVQGREEPGAPDRYQPDGSSPRGLAIFTAALFGMIGLGLVAVWVMFIVVRKPVMSAVRYDEQLPRRAGDARFWVKERLVLQRRQQEEMRRLGGYAWIDRRRGVVQLPIERAMDLLLEQRGSGPASAPASRGAP